MKDGRIEILRSVLLEDEIGNVQWHNETSFSCNGHGNSCGRCIETDGAGHIIREGIYTHIRDDNGEIVTTRYNWHEQYHEEI